MLAHACVCVHVCMPAHMYLRRSETNVPELVLSFPMTQVIHPLSHFTLSSAPRQLIFQSGCWFREYVHFVKIHQL